MKSFDNEAVKKDKIRLQVFISHSGFCSRRQAMTLVQEGRVTVNGRVVTEPSTPVGESDKVAVNGRPLSLKKHQYVLLNKPQDYVTTTKDPFAEKTVLDLLPPALKHLNPAGRLDKDTEGLLLLTNDGDVAYKITHPKFNVQKVYAVTIYGRLKPEDKQKLEKGIKLEEAMTAPAKISDVKIDEKTSSLRITIHEGKKRQVRRMFGAVGYHVIGLKREAQGPLRLGDLKTGQWRELTASEISTLKKI